MNQEPVLVITSIRYVLNALVQGLILWDVVTLTTEQHVWVTVTLAGVIESVLWLITRNEVWAPTGQPTHPPTEELWRNKVAAVTSEYEALFSAPGHTASAPASHEANVAMVDSVNPGAAES